jgi:hypothetical protein
MIQDDSSPEQSVQLWSKRFELLVLRALDLCLIGSAIVFLLWREWFLGVFFFIAGFLVGAIGQGLPHRRKQPVSELRRQPGVQGIFAEAGWSRGSGIPPAALYAMTSSAMKTACVVALLVGMTLYHFEFKWYAYSGAAILAALLFVPISILTVIGISMLLAPKPGLPGH